MIALLALTVIRNHDESADLLEKLACLPSAYEWNQRHFKTIEDLGFHYPSDRQRLVQYYIKIGANTSTETLSRACDIISSADYRSESDAQFPRRKVDDHLVNDFLTAYKNLCKKSKDTEDQLATLYFLMFETPSKVATATPWVYNDGTWDIRDVPFSYSAQSVRPFLLIPQTTIIKQMKRRTLVVP